MYIVKNVGNCVFSLVLRIIIYFNVYIILDFPVTYIHYSVSCACLHKTVNKLVLVKR